MYYLTILSNLLHISMRIYVLLKNHLPPMIDNLLTAISNLVMKIDPTSWPPHNKKPTSPHQNHLDTIFLRNPPPGFHIWVVHNDQSPLHIFTRSSITTYLPSYEPSTLHIPVRPRVKVTKMYTASAHQYILLIFKSY